jgi:hypothetical protein
MDKLVDELNQEFKQKEKTHSEIYYFLKENYPYIIAYLSLQIPLLIFNLNPIILSFFGLIISVVLIFGLWQIFIIVLMYIIIVNKKKRC